MLYESLTRVLNKDEFFDFYLLQHIFVKGFKYAKNNDLLTSQRYFNIGEIVLAKLEKEPNSVLYDWSLFSYLSKKSYLLHRTGNIFEAKGYIDRNIYIINKLIQYGGNDFLIFPFIQQKHNSARLLFSRGEFYDGVKLITSCLNFLLQSTTKLKINSAVSLTRLLEIDPENYGHISDSYIGQLFVDLLVSIKKVQNFDDFLYLYDLFFEEIEDGWRNYKPYSTEGHKLKNVISPFFKFFYNKQIAVFLNAANELQNNDRSLSKEQLKLLVLYIHGFESHADGNYVSYS